MQQENREGKSQTINLKQRKHLIKGTIKQMISYNQVQSMSFLFLCCTFFSLAKNNGRLKTRLLDQSNGKSTTSDLVPIEKSDLSRPKSRTDMYLCFLSISLFLSSSSMSLGLNELEIFELLSPSKRLSIKKNRYLYIHLFLKLLRFLKNSHRSFVHSSSLQCQLPPHPIGFIFCLVCATSPLSFTQLH